MASKASEGIDRRTFVKTVAGALAPPAVGSLAASTRPAGAKSRPPNVIVMICDDLGSGDLHCYGSSLHTPNLDHMAAEGVRFTRFNTAHPICSASRAALLTGRYSSRTHTGGAYGPTSQDGTDLDEKTLADILKPRGYRSMAIGKWHLGFPPPYLPTSRGFDAYLGVPWSVDMNPLPLLRDASIIEQEPDRDLLTPRYTEEAVKFIDSAGSHPFFLYVAYSYPHDPPRSAPRFRGHSQLGYQGDSIEEIDWSAGEIMEAVRRNGLDQDTIFIFTSDHGPWFQGCPGPLRGRKSTTFEGGVRIPFLIRWNETIPGGRVVNEWGSNLDVVPTIASFCGAELPNRPYDGVNLARFLRGESSSVERGTILYFAVTPDQQILECARKGNWKLRISQRTGEIYINDWAFGGTCAPAQHILLPRPELYNLERDPTESYDAAIDHPDVVGEIQQGIEAMIPGFPPNVVKAYADLKANPGSPMTPPGAAPRPKSLVVGKGMWVPPWRRG